MPLVPGEVATADRLAAGMTSAQPHRYDALVAAITNHARGFASNGVPAAHAARVVADAVTAEKPRTRYTVGRDAAALVRLARLVPDRVLDSLLRRTLKPHYSSAATTIRPRTLSTARR